MDNKSRLSDMITTHAQIIDLWEHPRDLAGDLGEKEDTVRKWRTRNRIPGEVWVGIVKSAASREIGGVTLSLLANIAALRRAA